MSNSRKNIKNDEEPEPYPDNMTNASENQSSTRNDDENTIDSSPSTTKFLKSKDEMTFFEKNLFIVWDEGKNFSCKCPKGPLIAPFWEKKVASNHSRVHGYDIQGNSIQTIKNSKTILPEQSRDVNKKIEEELEKLEQPNVDDILFSKVQEGVQTNIVSSIVNDLKDIAKDAEIMYVFQKLKNENKIPKNITFAAFVKDLLGYYCNKFGFNFMFYQDTTKLGPVELEIQKEILKENMVK